MDNNAARELLPCPFCGHTGISFIYSDTSKWGCAQCQACGAQSPDVRTQYHENNWYPEAQREWNTRAALASNQPVAVDVPLLKDAITLMTKSLAGLLTDKNFASYYAEDHRKSTPRWVLAKFAHDDQLRIAYVNDINQYLNWIRNATEKVRALAPMREAPTREDGGCK